MADYTSYFVFDDFIENEWAEYDEEESEEQEDRESRSESKITIHEDSAVSPIAKLKRVSRVGDYRLRWKKEQDRQAAIREQEKREQFRKLIGLKMGKSPDGESVETVLSCEEAGQEAEGEKSSSEDSGHVCLKNIAISDSQLRLSTVYDAFSIPDESGPVLISTEIRSSKANYKTDGIEKFFYLAREMKLRGISSAREMLQTDTLNLRYYGIDSRIVQAISEAIVHNTSVQNIDLTDNWLTPDACYYLDELLLTNDVVSHLDLSACKIGPEGAKKLRDGISASSSLVKLNLSRCKIGDEGLKYIGEGICQSQSLETVILTDNDLKEDAAYHLGEILSRTKSLKHLNISWNYLSVEKLKAHFFQGLSQNSTLEYLNLSKNELGGETAKFLSTYLSNSPSLRELDLSGNRFTAVDASQIAKSISKNKVLEILRLGDNPLEAAGAFALVNSLIPDKSPELQLILLDLENVWAKKDIIPKLELIEQERPWLNVVLGGILSNYKLLGPDTKRIFLKRANFEATSSKKKKHRRNFGHFVLSLKDEIVSKENFKDSVKHFQLKLTESLVDEIARAFETVEGRVDLAALKEIYFKEFPDTEPPAVNQKK